MTERCFLHDSDSEKYLWTQTVNVLQTMQFWSTSGMHAGNMAQVAQVSKAWAVWGVQVS